MRWVVGEGCRDDGADLREVVGECDLRRGVGLGCGEARRDQQASEQQRRRGEQNREVSPARRRPYAALGRTCHCNRVPYSGSLPRRAPYRLASPAVRPTRRD